MSDRQSVSFLDITSGNCIHYLSMLSNCFRQMGKQLLIQDDPIYLRLLVTREGCSRKAAESIKKMFVEFREISVTGGSCDAHVKRQVRILALDAIPLRNECFKLAVSFLYCLKILIRPVFRRQAMYHSACDYDGVEKPRHFVKIERGDTRHPAISNDKAFGNKLYYGFSNRCSRHRVLGGNASFVDDCARPRLQAQYAVAQSLVNSVSVSRLLACGHIFVPTFP